MKKNDKKLLVEQALAKLFADPAFTNPVYEPDSGFTQDTIERLRLFAAFDQYASDDRIAGGYNNLRFEHADVRIVGEREKEEEEDPDDEERTFQVTLFQGPVLRFTFDKAFPGPLRVISRRMSEIDYSSCRVRTLLGKTRVTAAQCRGWTEVTTEAQPFNDEFLAFARDPIAGMRILKPQAIEKICALAAAFGHPMIFLFEDTEMMAFLHTDRETFAISARKSPEEQIALVDRDIAVILKFLEGMEDLLPDSGE